jgi:hypothetical protein
MTTLAAATSIQAVQPEADERDRAGGDPGGERDRELDQMPAVPDPGEQLRPLLQTRAVLRCESRPLAEHSELAARSRVRQLDQPRAVRRAHSSW